MADANKAVELDPLLTKAYLRKGYVCMLSDSFVRVQYINPSSYIYIYICMCRAACMKLGEYRTAKTALEKGASIAPTESKFNKLIDECDLRISGIINIL